MTAVSMTDDNNPKIIAVLDHNDVIHWHIVHAHGRCITMYMHTQYYIGMANLLICIRGATVRERESVRER